MKKLFIVLLLALVLVAGCTQNSGDTTTTLKTATTIADTVTTLEETTTTIETSTTIVDTTTTLEATTTTLASTLSNFELLISDKPANISDFDYLDVYVSEVRIFEKGACPEINGTNVTDNCTAYTSVELDIESFDLTQLIDENALSVFNMTLTVGNYSKIEVHVYNATGSVGNETVDVKVPSSKLQITKGFEIVENELIEFVFDINVIKKGNGDYNLQPIISKSGVVGRDVASVTKVTREQAKVRAK